MQKQHQQIEQIQNRELPLNKIFSQILQTKALAISPRLSELYQTIHSHFSNYLKEKIQAAIIQDQLTQAFSSIKYKQYCSNGSFCTIKKQQMRYYRCFDCELNQSSCLCQDCFIGGNHQNHRFRSIQGDCFCDCGDTKSFKKSSFCLTHKQPSGRIQIPKAQAQLFKNQMQFLLLFGVRTAQHLFPKHKDIRDVLLRLCLQILINTSTKSQTYQLFTAQILINQIKEQNKINGGQNILQILLGLQLSAKYQNLLIQMLKISCLSVQKLKRKVIIYYINLLNSVERFIPLISPIHFLSSYFVNQLQTIYKYLQNGKIMSISIYEKEVNQNPLLSDKFKIVYGCYVVMCKQKGFNKIVDNFLRKTNICQLFSYHLISPNIIQQDKIKEFSNSYLKLLILFIKQVPKLQNSQQVYFKVIRQCYSFIKNKKTSINFCAQRTIAIFIFSFYKQNLDNIRNITIQQIKGLLNQAQQQNLKQGLQNMINQYFQLLKLQNYSAYRQSISDNKIDLNKTDRIILSLDQLYFKITVNLLFTIYKLNYINNFIPLEHFIVSRQFIQQKWISLYQIQYHKKAAINQQHMLNQIKILFDTKLFIKIEDQLSVDVIDVCIIINNIIFALQSQLPDIVIANLLNNPSKQKIMAYYRQCSMVKTGCSKLQLKKYLQKIIDNQQLIEEYFMKEYNSKMVQSAYISNLSFSNLTLDLIDLPVSEYRFKKKMLLAQTTSKQTPIIFNCQIHKLIIKFYNTFINHIVKPQTQFNQQSSLKVTLKLMIQTLIVLYVQTKNNKYKELILSINKNSRMHQHVNYLSSFVQLFQEKQSNSQSKQDEEKIKKEMAKDKKQLKMKEMKNRQQKILQTNKGLSIQANDVMHEQGESCIICKANKENQTLNYLCFARFNNLLSTNLYKLKNPFVVITTCGHKIHEQCLSKNINKQNEYKKNYKCFLCKQTSNIRLPIILPSTINKRGQINKFIHDLSAVLTIQLAQNTYLLKIQDSIQLQNPGRILFTTIVYGILLYYNSFPKLYLNNMLPIANLLFHILKQLNNPQFYQLKQSSQELNQLKQTIVSVIKTYEPKYGVITFKTEKQPIIYDKKAELLKLFNYLKGKTNISFNDRRGLQYLGFYKLPKDIVQLHKQIGKCHKCSRLTSKLLICLYCSLKICKQCTQSLQNHIQNHLGSIVTIDIESGRYYYMLDFNRYLEFKSIYCNYIGEYYEIENGLPQAGKYLLSVERYDDIINHVIRDNIRQIVQQEIQNIQNRVILQNTNCQIQ